MRGGIKDTYNQGMEETPLPTGPDVNRLMVPEELLRKQHEANDRLREARKQLAEAQESSDYDHQRHVTEKMEGVRQVEKEVEELEKQVKEVLTRNV
jgi:hypothetical protein